MASLNKVMLIGNAGKDAELRYTANGTAQAGFSLAVNRNFRGPDNEWKSETEWFNIVVWRDQAERVSQMVTKGKQVYVEGRLQTRSWDDDQGAKRYRTEVIAERVMMLGVRDREDEGGDGWGDGNGGGTQRRAQPGAKTSGGWNQPRGNAPDDPDDLPFE